MKKIDEIRNDILNGHIEYLSNVSIDNVIFGYHGKELKVLLQRPQGISKWMLPGGYIKRTESIDGAAKRIAKERTGLNDLYLKQFKAFGRPGRNKDAEMTPELISRLSGLVVESDNWMFDYFVSLGYYTLTEFEKVSPNGEFYMEECQWWDIHRLPQMQFDHKEIISEALKALQLNIYHLPIGYELLPEKFTLPEIHALYETILEIKLDSRNFSKKLLKTGIIKKLNEQRYIGAHRSPFLYTFDKDFYNATLREGTVIVL
jgi:8-oxo-dGTP diphosphatase